MATSENSARDGSKIDVWTENGVRYVDVFWYEGPAYPEGAFVYYDSNLRDSSMWMTPHIGCLVLHHRGLRSRPRRGCLCDPSYGVMSAESARSSWQRALMTRLSRGCGWTNQAVSETLNLLGKASVLSMSSCLAKLVLSERPSLLAHSARANRGRHNV
jgi:hypothetical protein